MLVALESGTGIGGSGFIRGIGCGPIYGSLDIQNDVIRPQLLSAVSSSSSSSSSSIGKDSCTESEDSDDGAMGEVQSAYKGALQGMGALEESLPIRRSISNFYVGKSKSFTNLSEAMASCASSKDLAKAENAYTRTRRNLLASRIFWERPCKNFLRSPGGGIAKRPGTPARSTLGLAVSMSSSNNSSPRNDDRHCKHLPPTPHTPCVRATMAIYDMVQLVRADVSTVALGIAASTSSIILGAGTKGKRLAMPNTRIMLHQPLGGASGQAIDVEIQAKEIMHNKDNITRIISSFTGRSFEQVQKDIDRDRYMSPIEAVEYGIIDGVIDAHSIISLFPVPEKVKPKYSYEEISKDPRKFLMPDVPDDEIY